MRACRPARVRGGRHAAVIATVLQQPHQQCLLGVQPVLGLVPHRAVRPVDHLVGDLVPAVGGKAVQHNGFGVRAVDESRVDLERPERPHPVQAVVLLTHRRPGVGDQHVGAVGGRLRVGGHGDRRAGLGGPLLGGRDELRVRARNPPGRRS